MRTRSASGGAIRVGPPLLGACCIQQLAQRAIRRRKADRSAELRIVPKHAWPDFRPCLDQIRGGFSPVLPRRDLRHHLLDRFLPLRARGHHLSVVLLDLFVGSWLGHGAWPPASLVHDWSGRRQEPLPHDGGAPHKACPATLRTTPGIILIPAGNGISYQCTTLSVFS